MSTSTRVARILAAVLVLALAILPMGGALGARPADPPTVEEVREAIARGLEWLVGAQNWDGSWGGYEQCAMTALVVKKLEHHAVDPKWGMGLASPFDPAYIYKGQVESGLAWLFANCVQTIAIGPQPAGDPDSNGNGIGVYWQWFGNVHHRNYTSGIGLMMICEAVEFDRVVEVGPLAGWTYAQVARDTMDYLAFGQNDGGAERGGWGYWENHAGWSDQSNAGYVSLGLDFAEADPPLGCGYTVPQFVKDELNIWVGYIQNTSGAGWHADPLGGSGYTHPESWVNILKTGNLLHQMGFLGDTAATPRVQAALDYMHRHWYDADQDPGWMDGGWTSNYQATFTSMKGFTKLNVHEFGDPPIDWQADFEEALLAEQHDDGSWNGCNWGDQILCTTWALLTLQKVAPPFTVPVDIKPTSCPNPLNVKAQGVLPAAILGTAEFDVTQVDPASVQLAGVAPLRWDLEDVATPYEPYAGKQGAYDCNEYGPDGYLDLSLKFDSQEIVAALGPVMDGDVLVLPLTGLLMDGTPFQGEDVILILSKGK